jgi:dUTP pyrophosphatase
MWDLSNIKARNKFNGGFKSVAAVEIKVEKTELAKTLEKSGLFNFDLSQKHPWDAGYDVRACIPEAFDLYPGERRTVPIGLKIELTSNLYEIQARPRSGLAAKNGIMVVNSPGTIDAGYKDEIMIILYNSDEDRRFTVNPGDRIAQLCIRPIPSVEITYVDSISKDNDRGGGFGSSGVK